MTIRKNHSKIESTFAGLRFSADCPATWRFTLQYRKTTGKNVVRMKIDSYVCSLDSFFAIDVTALATILEKN